MILKNIFFIICFYVSLNFAKAQYYINSFKEGIYRTIDEFIAKAPSLEIPDDLIMCYAAGLSLDIIPSDKIENHVVMRTSGNLNKIPNYFAIVQNGQIYIGQFWVNKLERSDHEKVKKNKNNSQYLRVLKDGKFLYLEGHFTSLKGNKLLKGAEKNENQDIEGGDSQVQSYIKTQGIILDLNLKEFDVFRTCENFNHFLSDHNFSNERIACGQKGAFNLKNVNQIIDKIIKN